MAQCKSLSPSNPQTNSYKHRAQMDLHDLQIEDDNSSDEDSADEDLDPIVAERKRRARKQDHLRRSAGEPVKPVVAELPKLQSSFVAMLRMVLAD